MKIEIEFGCECAFQMFHLYLHHRMLKSVLHSTFQIYIILVYYPHDTENEIE